MPSELNADGGRGRHREDVDGAVIMEEQGADAAEDDDDDGGGEEGEGKVNDSHSQSAVRGVGRPLTLSTVSTLYFLPPPPPSPTHRPSSIT